MFTGIEERIACLTPRASTRLLVGMRERRISASNGCAYHILPEVPGFPSGVMLLHVMIYMFISLICLHLHAKAGGDGFPSGITHLYRNDAKKSSLAPAQGRHAQIEKCKQIISCPRGPASPVRRAPPRCHPESPGASGRLLQPAFRTSV